MKIYTFREKCLAGYPEDYIVVIVATNLDEALDLLVKGNLDVNFAGDTHETLKRELLIEEYDLSIGIKLIY